MEVEDLTPVCDTLYLLGMKSAKDLIQAEYLDLKLDFLLGEEDIEPEDTQSESANLGAEGQKITTPIPEAAEKEIEKGNTSTKL